MTFFVNEGEIHPDTWQVFGMSAKETDSPIGMFGTGLKYAIAVLLREGRKVTIYSGLKKYIFRIKEENFRGETISHVYCGKKKMPFTTNLGKNWHVWMAYREIASNCFDEKGEILNSPSAALVPTEGKTGIEVDFSDIRHEDIFLDMSRPKVLVNGTTTAFVGKSPYIYHNGVRAYDLERPSIFTYNVCNQMLSEDRNLANMWSVKQALANALVTCTDSRFFRDILFPEKGSLESGFQYGALCLKPSKEFLEYVHLHRGEKSENYDIFGALRGHLPKEEYAEFSSSEALLKSFNEAKQFCKDIGFDQIDFFPIKFKSGLPPGVLAAACLDKQEIYLTERLLHQGVDQIAATLIEEYIHLAEGYNDCTYDMQTYLFDMIITMGKATLLAKGENVGS